jgi:hypothetical protein
MAHHSHHHDTRDNIRDAAIVYGAYKSGQAAKELRFQSWWITLTPAEQEAWRQEQREIAAAQARAEAEARRQEREAQIAKASRIVKAWERGLNVATHLQWIALPSLFLGALVWWILSSTDNDSAPLVPGVLRTSLVIFLVIEAVSWARYLSAKGRLAEVEKGRSS